MKSKTIIILYMVLFLIGMALSSFSQGIKNSGGYITDASSTNSFIKFSGNSDMTISGNTADQTTLGNLNVDFSSSAYKLTIPYDSYVTVEGNLVLADSLLLEANTSSNMASLITKGTVTGAYAIVEQHISADTWHMVSSPVASAVSGVYNGIYLYKWNEPDSTWAFITSTTEALTVARGYHAYSASAISSPTDVVFTGLLNTGNYSPSLSYNTGSDKGEGWNEIGNPYPSSIEWNSSWTKSSVDNTIYMYDGSQYKSWNYLLPPASNSLPNGEIPPTQGFWVKANAASPTMTIPNAQRVHSSNTFYKGGEDIQEILSINVSGNGHSDKMSVGMYENATNAFDAAYDAYKLMGIEAAPQLYSYDANELYAVNLLTNPEENHEVLLAFRTGADQEYTFSFEGIDNFSPSVEIYLEDVVSGEMLNLQEIDTYSFFAEQGLDEQRFILHFNPGFTGVNPGAMENQVSIYAYGQVVYVNYQIETPAQVQVYDLIGKEIMTGNITPNQLNKITLDNEKGYYIVKVVSDGIIKTQKVFIN